MAEMVLATNAVADVVEQISDCKAHEARRGEAKNEKHHRRNLP